MSYEKEIASFQKKAGANAHTEFTLTDGENKFMQVFLVLFMIATVIGFIVLRDLRIFWIIGAGALLFIIIFVVMAIRHKDEFLGNVEVTTFNDFEE